MGEQKGIGFAASMQTRDSANRFRIVSRFVVGAGSLENAARVLST